MLSFTPHEYEAPIPESLTRGGLIGVRGFPDGKPLSPRSLPRVRLPGLIFQDFTIFMFVVLLFFYVCLFSNVHICLFYIKQMSNVKFSNYTAQLLFGSTNNVKLWQKQFYIKYIGKSSSKSCVGLFITRCTEWILKNTYYKMCFTHIKIRKLQNMPYIFPPNSRSTAL